MIYSIWFPLFKVLFGIGFLYYGAQWLIRSAVLLSLYFGLDRLIIGMTVVAVSTSIPELLTCTFAQWKGIGDIALGNIVGANLSNIGWVLSVGLLLRPIPITLRKMDFPILLLATAFFGIILSTGVVSRLEGGLLIFLFACFFAYQIYFQEKIAEMEVKEESPKRLAMEILRILASVLFLFLGAEFLVQGASSIARIAGISERVIALTMVSIGTSLPELASVIVASRKGYVTITLGTVIGSNMFNTLFITGAAALVRPISFSRELFAVDFPVLAFFTILLWVTTLCFRILNWKAGIVYLLLYACYLVFFVF